MSGEQRHGYGKLTKPHDDGFDIYYDIYEGDWVNNQMHGKGIYKFRNGDIYEGDRVNGKKHGYGTYKYKNGDYYEGEWMNDKMHGKGK